jgi:hypothetical protein
MLFAKLEVLRATAGSDVHQTGALALADLFPGDHLVRLDGVQGDLAGQLGQVGVPAR